MNFRNVLDVLIFFNLLFFSVPSFARFLQVDPKREFHNSYSYVGNNPVMGVDPDGSSSFGLFSISVNMGSYYAPDNSGNNFLFLGSDGKTDGKIYFVTGTFDTGLGFSFPDLGSAEEQWFSESDALWMARGTGNEVGGKSTNLFEHDSIGSVILNRYNNGFRLNSKYLNYNDGFTIQDVVTAQSGIDAQFSEMGRNNGSSFWLNYPALLSDPFHSINKGGWNRCFNSALRVLSGRSLVSLDSSVMWFWSPQGLKHPPEDYKWIWNMMDQDRDFTIPGIDPNRFTFARK